MLSLGVLAFTHEYVFIFTILVLTILFSIIYGFFTIATVRSLLIDIEGFGTFNIVFYYIETILLTLLFFGILYYLIQPFKTKNKI